MTTYTVFLFWHNRLRWMVYLTTAAVTLVGWLGYRLDWDYTVALRRLTWTSVWLTSLQSVFGLSMHLYFSGYFLAVVRQPLASFSIPELRFFGWLHGPLMFTAIGLVHWGAARARKASDPHTAFHRLAVSHTLALLFMLSFTPWHRPLWR